MIEVKKEQRSEVAMFALGQKQTFRNVRAMSLPKADIGEACRDVRFVPKADIRPRFYP